MQSKNEYYTLIEKEQCALLIIPDHKIYMIAAVMKVLPAWGEEIKKKYSILCPLRDMTEDKAKSLVPYATFDGKQSPANGWKAYDEESGCYITALDSFFSILRSEKITDNIYETIVLTLKNTSDAK